MKLHALVSVGTTTDLGLQPDLVSAGVHRRRQGQYRAYISFRPSSRSSRDRCSCPSTACRRCEGGDSCEASEIFETSDRHTGGTSEIKQAGPFAGPDPEWRCFIVGPHSIALMDHARTLCSQNRCHLSSIGRHEANPSGGVQIMQPQVSLLRCLTTSMKYASTCMTGYSSAVDGHILSRSSSNETSYPIAPVVSST